MVVSSRKSVTGPCAARAAPVLDSWALPHPATARTAARLRGRSVVRCMGPTLSPQSRAVIGAVPRALRGSPPDASGLAPMWPLADRETIARMAVSVLIVDDHDGFRAGARELLEADGFRVVGEAGNGRAAVEAVRRL